MTIRIFFSIFLALLINTMSLFSNQNPDTQFQAVFKCIFDSEAHNVNIQLVQMSKNGEAIIFFGIDGNNTQKLYRINSDGSDLTVFTLPQYVTDGNGIQDITISGDGTIAYFYSGLRFYKVVENTVTEIFNSDTDTEEFRGFLNLQATYDGNVVFFQISEDWRRGSVWQIDQFGMNLIKIVDPEDIIFNWGKGGGLTDYSISDNAGKIAFILRGYWEDEYTFINRSSLWLKTHTLGYKQLTYGEEEYVNHHFVNICGMGTKVLFHKTNNLGQYCYFTINSDGSSETELYPTNLPGNADMNYDGSKIFISDGISPVRMLSTAGLPMLEIMPFGFWTGQEISYSENNRLCVFTQYSGIAGIYIGHLNTSSYGGSPEIKEITFDPPVFPKNNPDAEFKLMAEVSSPGGLDEIEYVKTEIIYNGENVKFGYDSSQVYFPKHPNDNGEFGDESAGDGIYTTLGVPTARFNDSEILKDRVHTRVIAHNKNHKIFSVQDVVFSIENTTAVEDIENLEMTKKFYLEQNYPNPFNPTTTINYAVPFSTNIKSYKVNLIIYDFLGNRVKVLVDKIQSYGRYSAIFDAQDLSSGIYYYKITVGVNAQIKKMVLLK